MPSLLNEEHYSLAQVAQHLGVHVGSVLRWTHHGVRGKKLHSVFIGGRRFVTRSSLWDFIASEVSPADSGGGPRQPAAEAFCVACTATCGDQSAK